MDGFYPGADFYKCEMCIRDRIVGAVPMGSDTLLEIAFEKVGTKKLMANFARLEKLDG